MRTGKLLILFLPLLVTGCVSLSKYNSRIEEIKGLNSELSSLEGTLQQSESARRGLESELQKSRETLASLQEEHEMLLSRSFSGAETGGPGSAIEVDKREFHQELKALSVKLADAEAQIAELAASLAAREEAAKKVPTLEAALAEREGRIKDLNDYMLGLHTKIAQLRKDTEELARKRIGSDEKENAVVAIRSMLADDINKGEISVKEYRDRMIISLKEQVLFDSGSARISSQGQKTLNRMARILTKVKNNRIVVEGHADTRPIGRKLTGRFPTNWELAAARATNVLKHLEQRGKVKSELLAMAGYGCYLPAAANDCAKNMKLNRRIEIAILPMDETRIASAKEKRL